MIGFEDEGVALGNVDGKGMDANRLNWCAVYFDHLKLEYLGRDVRGSTSNSWLSIENLNSAKAPVLIIRKRYRDFGSTVNMAYSALESSQTYPEGARSQANTFCLRQIILTRFIPVDQSIVWNRFHAFISWSKKCGK